MPFNLEASKEARFFSKRMGPPNSAVGSLKNFRCAPTFLATLKPLWSHSEATLKFNESPVSSKLKSSNAPLEPCNEVFLSLNLQIANKTCVSKKNQIYGRHLFFWKASSEKTDRLPRLCTLRLLNCLQSSAEALDNLSSWISLLAFTDWEFHHWDLNCLISGFSVAGMYPKTAQTKPGYFLSHCS